MIIFCSLEINGIDNLKNQKGNYIIASNHLSEMDPLLIVSILPFFSKTLPLIYVSRQKKLYTGAKWKQLVYGGIAFKMIGAYPSYKGLKDYKLALRNHLLAIERGKNVAIFPYGGIIRNNKPAKARGGVSFLAHETKLPIIPLKITGTEHFTLPNVLFGKKKVIFTFGKPIYMKDLFNNKKITVNNGRNDYQDAASIIMNKVENLG